MKVLILNPKQTIYEGEAWSVFLPGDTGEFEALDRHKPIMSLLKAGQIVIDQSKYLNVKRGIVKLYNDELVALVEE